MKIFYNFIFAIKSIRTYGVFFFIKCIFYEFYYMIKFKDINMFRFNKDMRTNYELSKKSLKYSTPNIPTPFFFLVLIKNFLKKKNFLHFNLIDLGCGNGRIGVFFNNYFKINFFGIDFSKEIIDENIKKFPKKNFFFLNHDLRKLSNFRQLNFITSKKNKKNFLYIIFISDSFEALLIIKLLKLFKKKLGKFLFVMVNQKNIHLFKDYKCIKFLAFKTKKKNISFYMV